MARGTVVATYTPQLGPLSLMLRLTRLRSKRRDPREPLVLAVEPADHKQ
jgi:hypothetical protein